MRVLEALDITKRFGGLLALNKVTIALDDGERVAIVGPNGSGKTTLMNIINGVYIPDEGRIAYMGVDITRLPPHERARMGIARAFQIPRPFPGLTVRENVAVGALFGAAKASAEEALEIADEELKLVGLYGKRDEPAAKLTTTELKLLELARALAMRPRLLLLDEIMAGMPPVKMDSIVGLIREVSEREKIAVVALVEHVMRAVVKFAERVVLLNQGVKILEGAPDEVLRNPIFEEVYLGKPRGP